MWGFHAWQIAWYGLGLVGLACALWRLRHAARSTRWAVAGLFLSLGFSRIPVARYGLPLLPVLAVEAGIAVAALPPPRRAAVAALAALPPLALSCGQVGILRDAHTAQRAADWISAHAAPGASIARLWPEYPLLDERRYATSELRAVHAVEVRPSYQPLTADLVVLDDLSFEPFPAELAADLERHYRLQATFSRPPRMGPLVLPEPGAAHDWKYTHPALRVLRRVGPE
jgi:hypothetical protein